MCLAIHHPMAPRPINPTFGFSFELCIEDDVEDAEGAATQRLKPVGVEPRILTSLEDMVRDNRFRDEEEFNNRVRKRDENIV